MTDPENTDDRMNSIRSNTKLLGIVGGLLIIALGASIYMRRNAESPSITYMGKQETPLGPRALFEFSNSLPYRINWITLEPEFELKSGWTIAALPTVPGGKRVSPAVPPTSP